MGNSCGKISWENLAGNSYGKFLWENFVGNSCGKILWEILVGKSCRKFLWEMLQENIAHFLKRVIKNVQSHDFYRVFKSF